MTEVGGFSVPDLSDPFAEVIGQDNAMSVLRSAVSAPVPAYLLLGGSGAGVRTAGLAFAGELLADGSLHSDEPGDRGRHARLARSGEHPDLVLLERVGPFVTADQAREAVRAANTSPIEGRRKVVMLTDLHLVRDAAPMLLKAVEEPPPSTFFVLLADEMTPELVTIASRCVVVEFAVLAEHDLVSLLIERGVDPEAAQFAAAASGGSIDRARLLVEDDAAAERWETWSSFATGLDRSGARAAAAVDLVLALIEQAASPLEARHAREREELDQRAEQFGERGLGRSGFEDRIKRELRRQRTDELKMGFQALGGALRQRLVDGELDVTQAERALQSVHDAGVALVRNPNERLLLQRLFLEVGQSTSARGAESYGM